MTWRPAQELGDRDDPYVARAKKALGRYSYGKNLGALPEYTLEFGVALRQFQSNRSVQVAFGQVPGPQLNTNGVLDWVTKKQLGILNEQLTPARILPVGFTVDGHMSNWDNGLCYTTAKVIEDEGHCRLQPVSYDTRSLPFNNSSGITEMDRLFNDPAVLPRGTPSFIVCHSQGGIVVGKWWKKFAEPNLDRWPYSQIKGVVCFGNPYRGTGQIAPWVTTPPKPGTRGISNERVENPPAFWREVANTGDLYAENEADATGEHKTAIYRAVQNEWTGPGDTLSEQIKEIVTGGPDELWAVFRAIAGGVKFLANMGPHGNFDLRFAIHYLKHCIGVVPREDWM